MLSSMVLGCFDGKLINPRSCWRAAHCCSVADVATTTRSRKTANTLRVGARLAINGARRRSHQDTERCRSKTNFAEDVLALQHQLAAIKLSRSMNKGMNYRVKVSGHTLFWLDSFSSEMVNVRKALARHIFKWPPVVSTIRLKRVVWSCHGVWNSTQVNLNLRKTSYRGESWLRHVEFAATFLKTPVTFGRSTLL